MYTLNLLAVLLLSNFLPRWTVLLLFPLTIFYFVETFQFTYNSLAELYIKISQYYAHFLNYFFFSGRCRLLLGITHELSSETQRRILSSILFCQNFNLMILTRIPREALRHQQITANPRAIFILMCSAYAFWLSRAHIRLMLWCDSRGSDLGRRSLVIP